MPPSHSTARARRRRQAIMAGLVALSVFAVATMLDGWGYSALSILDARERALVESKDWYRLLRILGYFPTWIGAGLLVFLIDSTPGRFGRHGPGSPAGRGVFLITTAGLAGLLAEALKIVSRRGRPIDFDGQYAWVPFEQTGLSTSDLGFPSSHAAVAFGAAFALSRLHPRAAWVMLPAAMGCGLTRVLAGQHFLSDVVGGAIAAWLVVSILARLVGPRGGGGVAGGSGGGGGGVFG